MKITSPLISVGIAIAIASCAHAFTVGRPQSHSHSHARAAVKLFAEGGAPQYDKIDATLREAEVLGEGSVALHIDVNSDIQIDYEPGHVLALEIEGDDDDASGKNAEDAAANGGWMRGPYTVSRATDTSFDVIVKVVGEKSKRMASAAPGTPLKFGGKFKVPILEGVHESAQRVILISTGVGAGPCAGAIEKALALSGNDVQPPIHLVASYRTQNEVLYKEHFDKLQGQHPERFSWDAIITGENGNGRLSSSEENMNILKKDGNGDLSNVHFHLIGNGQMVNEFKEGLARGGVSEDFITTESYFNHKAPVDEHVMDRIAGFVSTPKSAVPAPAV